MISSDGEDIKLDGKSINMSVKITQRCFVILLIIMI